MPDQSTALTRVSKPAIVQPGKPLTHFHGPHACDKDHSPEAGEPQDPVMLAIERDQSWELMKHYERRAERASQDLEKEREYRRHLQIKAQAFDRIATIIARSSKLDWAQLAAIITEANQKVERMTEALKQKAQA